VVVLTGLAGAGHEELSAALFGAERLAAGRIEWKNRPLRPRHPLDARRAGIAYVPPDRRREGLIPAQGITENLTLACLRELAAAGWIKQAARRRCAETWCRRFDVALSHATRGVATLSGGNQQKVLLARWAAIEPELFILNEPTRGIDVKTREAIHRWIGHLVLEGRCVLLVSSDTHELIRLADRCLVFRGGRILCQLEPPRLDEHTLITAMMGN
jgi:ABC-type sugar transport system ATPase subunit